MALFGLFRSRPHEREAFALYGAAVAAARTPAMFGQLGIPDTLDGRFDIVALHVSLLIRRIRRDADPRAPKLAQAVFDAMFADMDVNLREMGVSDLAVGKRVRSMWEAFHGRAAAYEAALDDADPTALPPALARNVWRGQAPEGAPEALAQQVRAIAAALAAQPFASLLGGEATFPEALAA